jgi:hypothetical protein
MSQEERPDLPRRLVVRVSAEGHGQAATSATHDHRRPGDPRSMCFAWGVCHPHPSHTTAPA